MLRTLRPVWITLAVGLIASCATQLTERGSRIKIISAEEATSYQYVGIVEGSSTLTGLARHTGYQNALNEMLDKAAAMGADFVVIDKYSAPRYWTTSENVRAEAYRKQ
jgi:hypothetical protein